MFLYGLFLIPLIFAFLAVRTGFYPFKAAVTLTCLGLILLSGFFEGFQGRDSFFIVAAFLFSVGGDYYLSHRGEGGSEKKNWFVYGIALFFLAHVFYLGYASRATVFMVVPLLSLVIIFLVYYIIRLLPGLSDYPMKIAVFLYMVISCFSLVFMIGYQAELRGKICLVAGIGLIVFSDICIAEANFAGTKQLERLILPTYYAAHLAITLGLVNFQVRM